KNEVHIEPAMMMGDRFDGHVVQGHVDCVGEVSEVKNNGNSYDIFISLPKTFIAYVIPKGSITIDGVSLTVNEVFDDSFRLTIIPHTMKETLIRNYKKGYRVNIETDMFARYVAHIISHQSKANSLTWDEINNITSLY
ncbi:MAG: riboflavin synthase, partial [Thiovulaceae bacterium]|nr:riboflavin synthase [Sulfurimonadaceae bacterium]